MTGVQTCALPIYGYSLVRKVFELEENKEILFQQFDELNSTLGEESSKPHISYLPTIKKIEKSMKISAHITVGGFIENIPRVINENLDVIIDRKSVVKGKSVELGGRGITKKKKKKT